MENLKFKGTKGNWFYNYETPRTFRIGSDQEFREKFILVWSDDCISNRCDIAEAKSNAKLIAAAPDLLEALQAVQNDMYSDTLFLGTKQKINKAIKKALHEKVSTSTNL